MSVIIIEAVDSRLGSQIGIGYLKVKRFVINGLLTQFEDFAQILENRQGRDKKIVIGQVRIKVDIDVPINAVAKLIQPDPNVNINNEA